MKTTYNKLVRDKIPEIIEKSGKKCTYKRVSDEEVKKYLKEKLVEEVNEFIEATTLEEMMEEINDIYQVLSKIRNVYDIPYLVLSQMSLDKFREKGELDENVILEEVIDIDS